MSYQSLSDNPELDIIDQNIQGDTFIFSECRIQSKNYLEEEDQDLQEDSFRQDEDYDQYNDDYIGQISDLQEDFEDNEEYVDQEFDIEERANEIYLDTLKKKSLIVLYRFYQSQQIKKSLLYGILKKQYIKESLKIWQYAAQTQILEEKEEENIAFDLKRQIQQIQIQKDIQKNINTERSTKQGESPISIRKTNINSNNQSKYRNNSEENEDLKQTINNILKINHVIQEIDQQTKITKENQIFNLEKFEIDNVEYSNINSLMSSKQMHQSTKTDFIENLKSDVKILFTQAQSQQIEGNRLIETQMNFTQQTNKHVEDEKDSIQQNQYISHTNNQNEGFDNANNNYEDLNQLDYGEYYSQQKNNYYKEKMSEEEHQEQHEQDCQQLDQYNLQQEYIFEDILQKSRNMNELQVEKSIYDEKSIEMLSNRKESIQSARQFQLNSNRSRKNNYNDNLNIQCSMEFDQEINKSSNKRQNYLQNNSNQKTCEEQNGNQEKTSQTNNHENQKLKILNFQELLLQQGGVNEEQQQNSAREEYLTQRNLKNSEHSIKQIESYSVSKNIELTPKQQYMILSSHRNQSKSITNQLEEQQEQAESDLAHEVAFYIFGRKLFRKLRLAYYLTQFSSNEQLKVQQEKISNDQKTMSTRKKVILEKLYNYYKIRYIMRPFKSWFEKNKIIKAQKISISIVANALIKSLLFSAFKSINEYALSKKKQSTVDNLLRFYQKQSSLANGMSTLEKQQNIKNYTNQIKCDNESNEDYRRLRKNQSKNEFQYENPDKENDVNSQNLINSLYSATDRQFKRVEQKNIQNQLAQQNTINKRQIQQDILNDGVQSNIQKGLSHLIKDTSQTNFGSIDSSQTLKNNDYDQQSQQSIIKDQCSQKYKNDALFSYKQKVNNLSNFQSIQSTVLGHYTSTDISDNDLNNQSIKITRNDPASSQQLFQMNSLINDKSSMVFDYSKKSLNNHQYSQNSARSSSSCSIHNIPQKSEFILNQKFRKDLGSLNQNIQKQGEQNFGQITENKISQISTQKYEMNLLQQNYSLIQENKLLNTKNIKEFDQSQNYSISLSPISITKPTQKNLNQQETTSGILQSQIFSQNQSNNNPDALSFTQSQIKNSLNVPCSKDNLLNKNSQTNLNTSQNEKIPLPQHINQTHISSNNLSSREVGRIKRNYSLSNRSFIDQSQIPSTNDISLIGQYPSSKHHSEHHNSHHNMTQNNIQNSLNQKDMHSNHTYKSGLVSCINRNNSSSRLNQQLEQQAQAFNQRKIQTQENSNSERNINSSQSNEEFKNQLTINASNTNLFNLHNQFSVNKRQIIDKTNRNDLNTSTSSIQISKPPLQSKYKQIIHQQSFQKDNNRLSNNQNEAQITQNNIQQEIQSTNPNESMLKNNTTNNNLSQKYFNYSSQNQQQAIIQQQQKQMKNQQKEDKSFYNAQQQFSERNNSSFIHNNDNSFDYGLHNNQSQQNFNKQYLNRQINTYTKKQCNNSNQSFQFTNLNNSIDNSQGLQNKQRIQQQRSISINDEIPKNYQDHLKYKEISQNILDAVSHQSQQQQYISQKKQEQINQLRQYQQFKQIQESQRQQNNTSINNITTESHRRDSNSRNVSFDKKKKQDLSNVGQNIQNILYFEAKIRSKRIARSQERSKNDSMELYKKLDNLENCIQQINEELVSEKQKRNYLIEENDNLQNQKEFSKIY